MDNTQKIKWGIIGAGIIASAWPENTILPIGGVDPAEQAFLNKRYFRELKLFYFGIPVFL